MLDGSDKDGYDGANNDWWVNDVEDINDETWHKRWWT